MQDLKPAVFAQNLPANNLIRFSEDFGGETNRYQGFDVNIEGRFRNGAFLKAGIGATSRTFDICNLLAAGLDAFRDSTTQLTTGMGTEIYPDGTTRVPPRVSLPAGREDVGVCTRCPADIQLAGTYQYSRGVQTGGAGPSIQAQLRDPSARRPPGLARGRGPARRRARFS